MDLDALIARRTCIAELRGEHPEVVCGRVAAASEVGARVVDSTGWILVAGVALRPGDWVVVEGTLGRNGILLATRASVATPYRKSGHFGSPGDEFVRLSPRLGRLALRDQAMRAVRDFFHQRGFIEVETPLLVPSPGLELHLDAVSADDKFLITSPEYQLKRVLAGGADKVFSICRCFRRGERGPHHNPEFTMIEWYRAWAGYEAIMADTEELVASVARAVLGTTHARPPDTTDGGAGLELGPPWERITVGGAMLRWAGFAVNGDETAADLLARARTAGLAMSGIDDRSPWDDVFFAAFLEAVEPQLGQGRPTIVYEWPAPLAALARHKPGDPRVVERFEAYAGGLELCNAFGELTDPAEQRRRFKKDLADRAARKKPLYPVDTRFLAALDEGLPPCAGIALGIDRLMMLLLGASDIRDVVAFTDDEL